MGMVHYLALALAFQEAIPKLEQNRVSWFDKPS
jgi:hypothetical protein